MFKSTMISQIPDECSKIGCNRKPDYIIIEKSFFNTRADFLCTKHEKIFMKRFDK